MKCRMGGLIVTLALGLLCAPLAATAQRPGKVVWVALLSSSFPSPRSTSFFNAFWEELHQLGYVEGQDLAIEFRAAFSRCRPPRQLSRAVRCPRKRICYTPHGLLL
jgi:hypothetical protein